MSRAVSIRSQLKKYMQRFNLPLQSCEGDAKRLRRCLVSGYWRNGARWIADGTYRSVRGNRVCRENSISNIGTLLIISCRLCMFIQLRSSSPENRSQDGSSSMKWKKRKRLCEPSFDMPVVMKLMSKGRIRVITEIESDW
jgi:hypothetical protein